jgi:hypothetical protein
MESQTLPTAAPPCHSLHGANTVTSASHGQLRHDAASRAEFFTLIATYGQPAVRHA